MGPGSPMYDQADSTRRQENGTVAKDTDKQVQWKDEDGNVRSGEVVETVGNRMAVVTDEQNPRGWSMVHPSELSPRT